MKLVIGTYGKHWYTVEYSNNAFSNLEQYEGQDHSCICVKDGVPYSISEATQAGPCYLTPVDGTDLFISSNFGDGSVDLIRFCNINGSNRSFTASSNSLQNGIMPLKNHQAELLQKIQFKGSGPVKEFGRQIHSRIHQVLEFPWKDILPKEEYRYFLATDFGTDTIRALKFSSNSLEHCSEFDIQTTAGSGPRHLAFNIRQRLLYCICELSNEMLVYKLGNSSGNGKSGFSANLVQKLTIEEQDSVAKAAAGDLKMHPNGEWLYATRRLVDDGILVYRIKEDGLLEFKSFISSEKHPRMIHIADGENNSHILFVACKDGGIQVFPLQPSGSAVEGIGKPKASLYLPQGDFPVWIQPC